MTDQSETHRVVPGEQLDKATANAELAKSADWFNANRPLTIDLGRVESADSAGVALLLAWQRRAEAARLPLDIVNVPETIRAIIDVCGLAPVLPLDDDDGGFERAKPG